MAYLKVKPDAPSRGGRNDNHSSYRCLSRHRLSVDTEDPPMRLNEKSDALSRDCSKNYLYSYKSLLRQKLVLDTKDCFILGTKSITRSSPKRNKGRKKTITGYSHRPKEAKDPKYKKHFFLAAMQESRKPCYKGNMYGKVKTHLEMNGCAPSMMHSINEEPPRKQLRGDFGSVSKGLKCKQSFEVPEPGGGHQSASSRPILGSFRCTPEWTPNDIHEGLAIKKFRKRDPKFLQLHQPSGEPLKSTMRLPAGCHSYPPEVSTPFPYWRRSEIEEMKKLAQQERKEAARLTKMGLDCKLLLNRADNDLLFYLKKTD